MVMDRRTALKALAGAGAAAAGAPALAHASSGEVPREEMVGMLYDATLCIGCKACMVACREANGLEYDPGETLWDDSQDLSSECKNVIKLFHDGPRQSFMKMQCMHCIDPACVGACMLGSLQKRGVGGAVTWEQDLCVGCRYCQIGCPFNVPKFEWDSAAPNIVKCELCNHRLAEGGIPACVEVCPREAVIYGKREELLAEAKRRVAARPSRYNPKVYGEHDGGGTQVLYLAPAGVSFQDLGLPELGETSPAARVRGVQGLIYKGFVAPLALYAVLGTVIFRNHRRDAAAKKRAEEREEENAS